MQWLDFDPCDLSTFRYGQDLKQLGNQRSQIDQTVGPCTKYYDGDGKAGQALLKREIPVDR